MNEQLENKKDGKRSMGNTVYFIIAVLLLLAVIINKEIKPDSPPPSPIPDWMNEAVEISMEKQQRADEDKSPNGEIKTDSVDTKNFNMKTNDFNSGEFEDIGPEEFQVTKKDFYKWKSTRFGTKNPEVLTTNYHEWLITSRQPAFAIRDIFDSKANLNSPPIWCFDRFGQSKTIDVLGNTYYIGGEHEDHYDPDFCIYNDIVKSTADGRTTLFLYPEDVFPPTDFHSATLIGSDIFIIGTLGYWQTRQSGITNVFRLSLDDMSISKFETTGENPGWIFEHFADYNKEKNEIIVYGGKTYQGKNLPFSNNFDTYGLNVENGKWRLIKKACVEKWQFKRQSLRNSISLSMLYLSKSFETFSTKDLFKTDFIGIIGFQPNLQYLDELFAFPIEHTVIYGLQFGILHNKYIIKINGEQVLILIESNVISFVFSGNIDSYTIEQVLTHFNETLIKIGYVDIVYEQID